MIFDCRVATGRLVLLLAFAAGVRDHARPYDYASEPDPRKQEFMLGPSDVLKITVWQEPGAVDRGHRPARRHHLAAAGR